MDEVAGQGFFAPRRLVRLQFAPLFLACRYLQLRRLWQLDAELLVVYLTDTGWSLRTPEVGVNTIVREGRRKKGRFS